MRAILFFLLAAWQLSAAAWVSQTPLTLSPASPGNSYNNNDYSGAGAWNPWQQMMGGWWNDPSYPTLIYSSSLQRFNPSGNIWQQLYLNGASNLDSGCNPSHNPLSSNPVIDTANRVGSGHIGTNQAYDWRHSYLFVGQRYQCNGRAGGGPDDTGLFTWLDNPASPSTGWANGVTDPYNSQTTGPWHRLVSTQTIERFESGTVYDPLNNAYWNFGGNSVNSAVNTMTKYTYQGGVTAVTYNGVPRPATRQAYASWYDYKYADTHPGRARICYAVGFNGINITNSSVDCFYPNGDANIAGGNNVWALNVATSGTNPSGSALTLLYGWAAAYDTKRDIVWFLKSTTQMTALYMSDYTWHDYSVTGTVSGGNNWVGMVYDAANDQLIMTSFSIFTLDLSTVIPSSTACGSGYSTSAADTLVSRPIGYGSIGTQYRDPMGGCVTRVTTPAVAGNDNAVPIYSQNVPLDSSSRYFALADGDIVDVAGGATTRLNVNYLTKLTYATWSRTIAGKLIGVGGGTNSGAKIYGCLVSPTGGSPGSLSCSVIVDLSATYSDCGATDSNRANASLQDLDKDDTYKVLVCKKISDNLNYMIVVTLANSTVGVPLQLPPTATGGCPPLSFGPDFALVDYNKSYVVVQWGTTCTSAGTFGGMETFNLSSAANPAGSWTRTGQVAPAQDHGDLAISGGSTYWVSFAAGTGWGALQGNIVKCILPDGWSQSSHAGCTALVATAGGGHISAHAYQAPGTTSAIVSNYDNYNSASAITDVDGSWVPFKLELFQVYLDSTPGSPHVNRLAHVYTDVAWYAQFNQCPSISSYWAQPHATQTLDGTAAYMGTSWGPSGAGGKAACSMLTLRVVTPVPCSITPISIPPTVTGGGYSQTLTANSCGSGTITWTITAGSLPSGITGCNGVTGTTCTLSGNAVSTGTSTVTIQASDGGSNTTSNPYSLTVNAQPQAGVNCSGCRISGGIIR